MINKNSGMYNIVWCQPLAYQMLHEGELVLMMSWYHSTVHITVEGMYVIETVCDYVAVWIATPKIHLRKSSIIWFPIKENTRNWINIKFGLSYTIHFFNLGPLVTLKKRNVSTILFALWSENIKFCYVRLFFILLLQEY